MSSDHPFARGSVWKSVRFTYVVLDRHDGGAMRVLILHDELARYECIVCEWNSSLCTFDTRLA